MKKSISIFDIIKKDWEAFWAFIFLLFGFAPFLVTQFIGFLIIAAPFIIWMLVMILYRYFFINKIVKNSLTLIGKINAIYITRRRRLLREVSFIDNNSANTLYVIEVSYNYNDQQFLERANYKHNIVYNKLTKNDEIEILISPNKPNKFLLKNVRG